MFLLAVAEHQAAPDRADPLQAEFQVLPNDVLRQVAFQPLPEDDDLRQVAFQVQQGEDDLLHRENIENQLFIKTPKCQ